MPGPSGRNWSTADSGTQKSGSCAGPGSGLAVPTTTVKTCGPRRTVRPSSTPSPPPAPRCSGRPLPRDPSASDHAVAPAGGALLRPRAPGQPPPRDSRGLRRRVGDVPRRRGGGDWWRPTTESSAERTARLAGACEAQLGEETAAVRESLRAFAELGRALREHGRVGSAPRRPAPTVAKLKGPTGPVAGAAPRHRLNQPAIPLQKRRHVLSYDARGGEGTGRVLRDRLRLAGRGEKIHERVCRCGGRVPIREVCRARSTTATIRTDLGVSGTLGTCGASNASNETRRS